MPSAPAYPQFRAIEPAPRAAPSYETYQWYQVGRLVLPASTAFSEVIHFSGKPDSIILTTSVSGSRVRLRNSGEAPGDEFSLDAVGEMYLKVSAEIVEARDATGAGGATVQAIGRWATREEEGRRNHVIAPKGSNPYGGDERRKPQGGID